MKGNQILCDGNPRGKFLEGIISGTPLPGHNMQIKAAVEPIGGVHTWEVAAPSGGDGKPAMICILMDDNKQGKGVADAYVSGTRGLMYCPLPGEDMNVRVGEVAGTGNTLAIGDLLMSNAASGYFIPNSSGVSTPFQVMETETQQAADNLVWCKATGH